MNNKDLLEKDLGIISQVFDIRSILKSNPTQKDISKYYQKTRIAYRLIQSYDGFVHFAISNDNKFKKEDLKEQARIVDFYIKKTKSNRVLELAYGMGANSSFLARMNPSVSFEAIDYSNVPLAKYKKIPNLKFSQGDYHNFAFDGKYDLIFIIEALCHSVNKKQVFEQVYKNLKPGGLFIVFDGYSRKPDSELSKEEIKMNRLSEVGMSLSKLETIKAFENYSKHYFKLLEKRDLSNNILPNARYLHNLAKKYFHFPFLARLFNRLICFEVVKNSLPGLLLYDSLLLDVGCYYLHVFQRK